MSEPAKPNSPKVFISYTHENKDHKAWVAELATRLRAKGIDVTLDQWGAEPGDNLALFMQKGITVSYATYRTTADISLQDERAILY